MKTKKLTKLFSMIVALMLVISCASLFTACDKGDEGENAGNGTVAVTNVALDKTTLTLEEGETAVLVATVSPANATVKTVSWSTDKAAVATVSDGTVTAVSEGTATITVTTTTDGSKTATCDVTVTAKEPEFTKKAQCDVYCPVCGECTDNACELDAKKCGAELADSVLNAYDEKVETFGGLRYDWDNKPYEVPMTVNKTAGNVGQFRFEKCTVTYFVEASKATTATLNVNISQGKEVGLIYTDIVDVKVNDAILERTSVVPGGSKEAGGTSDTVMSYVNLGCVNLKEGLNEISFKATGFANSPRNMHDVKLSVASDVTLTHVAHHECPTCAVCGGCLSLDCKNEACATKCGGAVSGEPAAQLGALDATIIGEFSNDNPIRVDGPGSSVDPNYAALITPDATEKTPINAIMGLAKGTAFTYSFDAEKAGLATLILNVSKRGLTIDFAVNFKITLNGQEISAYPVLGALMNNGTNAPNEADWQYFYDLSLGCMNIKAGTNVLKVEVLKGGKEDSWKTDPAVRYMSIYGTECGTVIKTPTAA